MMPAKAPTAAAAVFPVVGACGTAALALNPGLCIDKEEDCPSNDRFRTKTVGFCADGERKCCSTLPKNVLRLPSAAAYPGLKCRTEDGRVGVCARFMQGCPPAHTHPNALCGRFANAQLCCLR